MQQEPQSVWADLTTGFQQTAGAIFSRSPGD